MYKSSVPTPNTHPTSPKSNWFFLHCRTSPLPWAQASRFGGCKWAGVSPPAPKTVPPHGPPTSSVQALHVFFHDATTDIAETCPPHHAVGSLLAGSALPILYFVGLKWHVCNKNSTRCLHHTTGMAETLFCQKICGKLHHRTRANSSWFIQLSFFVFIWYFDRELEWESGRNKYQ